MRACVCTGTVRAFDPTDQFKHFHNRAEEDLACSNGLRDVAFSVQDHERYFGVVRFCDECLRAWLIGWLWLMG